VSPGSNVEVKLRCADLERARELARALGARGAGVEHQIDTYFCTRRGRLKLRERPPAPAELIAYQRPDVSGARRPDYQILHAADPAGLRALLTELLGVHATVAKRREILLLDNVRIHLDRVEGLGDFLELEAVFDGSADSERRQHANVEHILAKLELAQVERIATSYEALIRG